MSLRLATFIAMITTAIQLVVRLFVEPLYRFMYSVGQQRLFDHVVNYCYIAMMGGFLLFFAVMLGKMNDLD